MPEPTWDEETDAGWYRKSVGHRIERTANRLLGLLLGAVGIWAGYAALASDEFTWQTHWFGLVVAVVMLYLARLCFRARRSIIQGFGEEPDGTIARREPK